MATSAKTIEKVIATKPKIGREGQAKGGVFSIVSGIFCQSGRKDQLANTKITAKQPKCHSGDTSKPKIKLAEAPPKTPPRLKNPWQVDMMLIPSARSIPAAPAFIVTLMRPLANPIMNIAAKKEK